MTYKFFVTILYLINVFFFHLNLSSTYNINPVPENGHTLGPSRNLFQLNSTEISIYMGTLPEENHPTFKLPLLTYPNQTIFREYIAPSLNSEKLCNMYESFYSKNPSISHHNFLPPERFFKSHEVLIIPTTNKHCLSTQNPELEQKILYNFQCQEEEPDSPFSQFNPILYNPIDKKLETVNPDAFEDSQNIPHGSVLVRIGGNFFPFQSKLNTQPFSDKNKTVMIVTGTVDDDDSFLLILEDSTDKNAKHYSIICNGEYDEKNDASVLLYKSRRIPRENVEYPKDIKFILKAKYIKGIQKYFFKFQVGHIKIFRKVYKKFRKFLETLSIFAYNVLDNDDKSCLRTITVFVLFYPCYFFQLFERIWEFSQDDLENPTKVRKVLHLLSKVFCFLFLAYIWLIPYKSIVALVFSPLYFIFSPLTFFLALNLEPITSALFWGPTQVYTDLQFGRTNYFQIFPREQMFAIATFKTPIRNILRDCFYAWFVMFFINFICLHFFA